MSQRCGGHTGLIAGCGFAVRILKSYLNVGDVGWKAQIRTYVDDITLSTVANTPKEVVRILGRSLPKVKAILAERQLVTSDAKRAALLPQKACS